jgi:hypothetical protein
MIPIEIARPIAALNPTMEKFEMKLRIMKVNSQFPSSLAGVCGVLLMLYAGQVGLAQQSTAAAAAAATTPTRQAAGIEKKAVESGKPGTEGIKVHGHWVIDLKNPDGTLAEHREFENALADKGQFLVALASGYEVFGGYFITLVGNACPGDPDGDHNCSIPQTGAQVYVLCNDFYTCVGGLTLAVNLTGTGTPAYSIVLSGSATMPLAGTISAVQTQAMTCFTSPTIGGAPTGFSVYNPAACVANGVPLVNTTNYNGLTTFTGTTLTAPGTNVPAPLAVSAGQIVQVTVTISFS